MKNSYNHPKHLTYTHPIVVYILTVSLYILLIYSLSTSPATPSPRYTLTGSFLISYVVLIFCSRLKQDGQVAVYEMLWQCNVSLLTTGISFIIGKDDMILSLIHI